MNIVDLLNIIMAIAIGLILVLSIVLIIILFKNKTKNEKESVIDTNKAKIKEKKASNAVDALKKESTFNFLDFDEVKDNMIIRKNRQQYVMVIECKGINYDLMSEEEKVAVEEGFTQFLNTLRFPVQLYVQTSSLNLKDIIEQYKQKLKGIQNKIVSLDTEINKERMNGNNANIAKLQFEKRRQENVLEYASDISEYVERLSQNRNVLQQKPYVVVSYYKNEIGKTDNFSKDEIDSMCFSELYTRSQTMIRSLSSSGVLGRVLSSEELVELLYIAYNREDSQYLQYSKAVETQYDSLYSTGKDILLKKEEQLEEQIERESLELATTSIRNADIKLKEKKEHKNETVKKKALEIVEEYKDQMKEDLYEQTKNEILGAKEEDVIQKPAVRKGRPKKNQDEE